jgi:molybdate transport system substrate-binding protein
VFHSGLDAARAVAAGRAALVLAQVSEILAVPGVVLAGPLPAAVNLVTPYAAAIATRAADRGGALALLRILTGPVGLSRFREAGFQVGA